jgi:predicted transcriptional regulator
MDAIPEFGRDVIMSMRPIYASKILEGQKTVELRRKFPEVGATRARVLIYSSSPVSAVVGLAWIRHVLKLPVAEIRKEYGVAACISKNEFDAYFRGVKQGFAIVLDGVQSLKTQLTAIDLEEKFGIVPPQSYRYLSKGGVALLSDEQFQVSDRHERGHRAGRP